LSHSHATPSPDPWAEAETAVEELRQKLRAVDITLPSLGLDVAAVLAGYPIVCLGSATADTVRKISAALGHDG
jgi:hypothetical protein